MGAAVFRNEFKKYAKCYQLNRRNPLTYKEMKEFFHTTIELYSDRLKLDADVCVPTLVVVVKDELDRMKLLYEHYRKLGVHQFIIVDNGSEDGTKEYVSSQTDTRVYYVKEPFQSQKKEAWIEKVLAITGYDRWYIVVDSDELIDYVGSENHSIEEMIRYENECGKKRLQGYMIDMYSQEALFSVRCQSNQIVQSFTLFDKDSYYEEEKNNIKGGPRSRVFGLKNMLVKQDIFCFQSNMLYNTHTLFIPGEDRFVRNSFIIRHYKFLADDRQVYQDHVAKQNYSNGSEEYKTMMHQIEQDEKVSFLYEHSVRYENSESLRQLPFLHWHEW